MGKANFLKNKFFVFAGVISYPLYLVHESIGVNLREYLLNAGDFISTLSGIFISVLLAYLITIKINPEITNMLKKRLFS